MLTYAAASAALDIPRYRRAALVDDLRAEEARMIRKSSYQAYTDHYLPIPRARDLLHRNAFQVGADKILEADAARLLGLRAFRESTRWVAGRFITDAAIAAEGVQALYDGVLGSLHPADLQDLRATMFNDFESLFLL